MSTLQITPFLLSFSVIVHIGCMSEGQLHHLVDAPSSGTYQEYSSENDQGWDTVPTGFSSDNTGIVGEEISLDVSDSNDHDAIDCSVSNQPESSNCWASPDSSSDSTEAPNHVPDGLDEHAVGLVDTDSELGISDSVGVHFGVGDDKSKWSESDSDLSGDMEGEPGEIEVEPLQELESAICNEFDAILLLECQQIESERVRSHSLLAMESAESALLQELNLREAAGDCVDCCEELGAAAEEAIETARQLSENLFGLEDRLELQQAYGEAIGLSIAARICLAGE